MSFPKAPLKRFNEHVGCAPPPGSYDVKVADALKGPVSFEKSQRFRMKKDSNSDGQSLDKEEECTSPVRLRKHSSHGSTPNLRQKPEKDSEFLREMKKQKMLEKEIRSLLKDRAAQDKKWQTLEEEFKKTETKLVSALREKTSLSANIASLERQIADLNKSNDLLKTKFSDDGTKKRLNSLCSELMETKNKVDAKDKELRSLQTNFKGQVVLLQNDLACSRTTLDSLRERNVILEESHSEAKVQREGLEKALNQAHSLIEALQRDHLTVQDHLSSAQEQIKNLCVEINLKDKECEDKLQIVNARLSEQTMAQEEMENQLRQAQKNFEQTLQTVTDLEEQLIAAKEEKCNLVEEKVETERKLAAALEEIGGLVEQAEKYKVDVELMEELLKHKEQEQISQKDLFSKKEELLLTQIRELEDNYVQKMQAKAKKLNESEVREESLRNELEIMRQKLSQGEGGLLTLQKKEEELHMKLQNEEDTSRRLRIELQTVQEEMMKERHLLEEELEGTLDDLDRLQHAEEEAEKLIHLLEQGNKQRAEELLLLEEALKKKTTELGKVKETHRMAILQLKEAQSNTLLKLAELESFKNSATTEIQAIKSTNMSLLKELALSQESNEAQQQLLKLQAKTNEDLEQRLSQQQDIAARTKESLEQQLHEQQEATARTKESLEQQLLEQQQAATRTKESLEQQLYEQQQAVARTKESLEQQLHEQREAAARTKESLEQQLHERQEATARIKESLEQQLHEQQEATARIMESLEQQLHEQLEATARTKESLEQQLHEQREATARIKESLEQQLHEQQEATARTKESLEQQLHEQQGASTRTKEQLLELQTSSTKTAEQQLELEELKMQLKQLQDCSTKTKHKFTSMLEDAQIRLKERETQMREFEDKCLVRESELKADVEQLQNMLQNQEGEMAVLRQDSARKNEAEENRWRTLYEELHNKVRPFQQQLDAFEAEKNALLNEHGAAQDELNKLSDAYAKLLGHQNQKQKIKHVMKLKTENSLLKQEVSKLRSQLAKEKQAEKQLQEHLNDMQGVKRFDPSKAFQHDIKENIVPKGPLREGNRKKV
ncbi:hyaluronan mediated motility receptor [Pelodytes ibericus]